MVSESARTFTIAGTCGVPQDASGVLLNVTVVNPTDAGYVGVFAAERQDFDARVTSFPAGTTRASSLILGFVPGGDGQLTVRLRAPGSAHVVLDVSGYFR